MKWSGHGFGTSLRPGNTPPKVPAGCLVLLLWVGAAVDTFGGGERGLIGPGQCGPDTTLAPPRSPDAWHMVERNVLDSPNSATRTRPQLFRYNGTWAILFGDGPAPGPMRLAVVHIHPSLLGVGGENGQ